MSIIGPASPLGFMASYVHLSGAGVLGDQPYIALSMGSNQTESSGGHQEENFHFGLYYKGINSWCCHIITPFLYICSIKNWFVVH